MCRRTHGGCRCVPPAGEGVEIGRRIGADRGQQVDARITGEGVGDAEALHWQERVAFPAVVAQARGSRRRDGEPQEGRAILHQDLIGLPGPVPFQHGEFGTVQRTPFAVAPDMGEGRYPRLTGRQQFLHRKFGRGVQVIGSARAVHADGFGRKGVQMRLVSGRNLHGDRVDLDEVPFSEPRTQLGEDTAARHQDRTAVGMAGSVPPGGLLSLVCGSRHETLPFIWRFRERYVRSGAKPCAQ